MRNFSKLFLLSLLGGIVGGYIFGFINRDSDAVSHATVSLPALSATPGPSLWGIVVTKLSPSFVGIQAFKNDRVIRQGSGVIVSSDGLIVTTADLSAPKGTIYQIFYEDDILQASVVAIDPAINLMLLKTSSLNPNIAEFSAILEHESAQELLLIGRVFDLSKHVVASQKGAIGYVTSRSIILDTVPNSYLYGFGALDIRGKLRGLTYLRNGQVFLVSAQLIEDFFKDYIETIIK